MVVEKLMMVSHKINGCVEKKLFKGQEEVTKEWCETEEKKGSWVERWSKN